MLDDDDRVQGITAVRMLRDNLGDYHLFKHQTLIMVLSC
jgi:hypothetical protein